MSDVYYYKLADGSRLSDQIKAMKKLMEASGFDKVLRKQDKVAVKTHVGEKNNDTHVPPAIIKAICERIKRKGAHPYVTETSTLYKGQRSNAIDHLNHAYAQGFTPKNIGAPFIMADGLVGNSEISVPITGKIFSEVNIAREVALTDALVVVSHPTGHMHAGVGAGIKNLGMGLASRIGKLRQHSSVKPVISARQCTFCRNCMKWCPAECITEKEGKAFINAKTCIGCGECLAVCRFDAVHYNWGTASPDLQRKMAEHALGVVQPKKEKIFFLNYLVNMTKDCDCMGSRQAKLIPDLGILASTDVVAIDQATLDLTATESGKHLGARSYPQVDSTIQLAYGQEIGLGTRQYTLHTL